MIEELNRTLTSCFEVKTFDEEGVFEGYASVFRQVDHGKDAVVPGAFSRTIAERGVKGVKLLWQHDPTEPLGYITELKEDQRGLFIKAKLNLDVRRAREALSLMRQGALDGLSIGFKTLKSKKDETCGVRHLFDLDLWEVSLVTFPMQPEARISSFKSDKFSTIRGYESFLRDAGGFSRSEAKALAAHGFKGITAEREAQAYVGNENSWSHILETIQVMENQLKN